MLSVAEAQQQILQAAVRLTDVENLLIRDTVGRITTEDLHSSIDVPPWDNSAMDGYAVRAGDIAVNSVLPVSQIIAAGYEPEALQAGTSARIFTGAPLPKGADCVVMQENVTAENDRVRFLQVPQIGANIRRCGEDIKQGDTIITAATLIKAQHLGLMASVGIKQIKVRKPLVVAVLSTGDELLEPGQELAPGKIYNSNRYLLSGLLTELGCEIIDGGMVGDDVELTKARFLNSAKQADVVISSGGVSVGDADYVKKAVEVIGKLDLWKIAAKPGKPLAFGEINCGESRATFFGLPGNPVSAFVTFLLFVKPYLLKCYGVTDCLPKFVPAKAGFDWPQKSDKKPISREEYLRVRFHRENYSVELYPHQGSGVLSSVVWADGLVRVPTGQRLDCGDTVQFLPFWDF